MISPRSMGTKVTNAYLSRDYAGVVGPERRKENEQSAAVNFICTDCHNQNEGNVS
jgi:hypothetical protein